MLFISPPVGIGLGIGSAVTGSVAYGADYLADWKHIADLKKQVSRDAYNAFVVAELLKEWVQARQALQTFPEDAGGRLDTASSFQSLSLSRSISSADGFTMGEAVDGGLTVGAMVDATAVAGTRIADQLGKAAFAATQALGVAGALISTGFAIRAWSTSKAGQTAVREKMTELSTRILQIQQLIASVDRLECPLCAEPIILADAVQRCTLSHHCFHAGCMKRWLRQAKLMALSTAARQPEVGCCSNIVLANSACCSGSQTGRPLNGEPGCPECGASIEEETDMLVETVEQRQPKMRLAGRNVSRADVPSAIHTAGIGGCRTAQDALMSPIAMDGRRSRRQKNRTSGLASCFATC